MMKKEIEREAKATAAALFEQPASVLQEKLKNPDYVAGLLAGFALRVSPVDVLAKIERVLQGIDAADLTKAERQILSIVVKESN